MRKVQVLLLAANPSDMARIAVGEEHREIDARIRASDGRDRFELVYAHEVRLRELGQVLQRHRPDVVHFSGHGSEEGELQLIDDSGHARPAAPEAVARLFGILSRDLTVRCVLLNACYSDALAQALTPHVDCVIGVPAALGDKVATSFAGAFYEALGFGRDVEASYRYACNQVDLVIPARGPIPNLHCRAGVRPEDVRLSSHATPAPPTTARSAPTPGGGPAAICTLPPYEDVRFVGRTSELAALDAWGEGDRRVLVLHGPPGVGKTRLAVEWAHRQAAAFPGGRYFLSFRADPHGALHGVARLRGVLQHPGERLDEWAIRALHHVGAERALVIFDDLQSAAEFAAWFEHLSAARAIVVTNERVWPAGYTKLSVDVLERGDARALARNVIGDDAVAARHVEDIVARAGCNAVQIVVDAGAVHEAVELGDAPTLSPAPALEAVASLERAWRTATDDARTLVCALALYRAQGTPTARVAEVLGADGWEEARTRRASSEAARRHLVVREAEALTLHPLLRTFARTKGAGVLSAAAREAHARAFVARATAFRLSPGDRAKYAEVAHDEFDLAVWGERAVALSTEDRACVGEALCFAGRFAEARWWYERNASEQRQGDARGRVDHAALGDSLHQVGLCLSLHGQFAEARGWYERAAGEHDEGDALGRMDHSSRGKSLHQVGYCASSLGQTAEARGWYERAAEAYRQGDALGRIDHSSLGASLHEVGRCLSDLGQPAEAQSWYERAADEKRSGNVHGTIDHASLGASLHAVAFCVSSQGRFTEAHGLYERAADEHRRGDVFGRVDHTSLGLSLHQVGFCLSSLGRFEEAWGWYDRAAEEMSRGDVYGRVDHASLGWSMHRAALCLSAMERLADARSWHERAVGELRQGDVFGRIDAARLALSLDALAAALDRLGLADDARAPREEAAQLRASPPEP